MSLEFETDNKYYYLKFRDQAERDKIYQEILPFVNEICLTEKSLENLTEAWVNRLISNYEYLININFLAQRSFNDLT